jgi:4-amino-4-deoxy-L-arabinose transferase-like glycosyltransferase
MYKIKYLSKSLRDVFPLVIILIGLALVSMTIGPFQNPDTAWEYKAANGVITWGMPFVEVQGSLINQPPLGFYSQGLFLTFFGNFIETGVLWVTLLGLSSAFVIYKIGWILYGRRVGLIAAVLFGLSMWELVLSRSFLIDTQCLFLSLCCLYTGILGIQKNSNKLITLSGGLFAIAIYTKLFAIFVLLPLGLICLYNQKDKLRRLPVKLAVFFLSLALATIVWYVVDFYMMPSYLPKGLGYLFSHSDFSDLNAPGVTPSYWSVPTFLLNYGLSYFFVATAFYSLFLGLLLRKHLEKKTLYLDSIFVFSIFLILIVNVVLGVTLNLKVPYTSTLKYAYQTLPLFSLIVASITIKCATLLNLAKTEKGLKRLHLSCAILGILLLISSLVYSIYSAFQLSTDRFILFRVELNNLLGYSFDNFHALNLNNPLLCIQFFGFGLILLGLIYAFRDIQLRQAYKKHFSKNWFTAY